MWRVFAQKLGPCGVTQWESIRSTLLMHYTLSRLLLSRPYDDRVMGQVVYSTIAIHCYLTVDFLNDSLLQYGMDDGTLLTDDLWVIFQSVKRPLTTFNSISGYLAVEDVTHSITVGLHSCLLWIWSSRLTPPVMTFLSLQSAVSLSSKRSTTIFFQVITLKW